MCAECARNRRHAASSSGKVRRLARATSAEFLAIASGLASPKAEVAGSNPVGSANFFNNLSQNLGPRIDRLCVECARYGVSAPFAGAAA